MSCIPLMLSIALALLFHHFSGKGEMRVEVKAILEGYLFWRIFKKNLFYYATLRRWATTYITEYITICQILKRTERVELYCQMSV